MDTEDCTNNPPPTSMLLNSLWWAMSNAKMLAALGQTNSSLDPIRKQLTRSMLTGRMAFNGVMEAGLNGWKILKRLFILRYPVPRPNRRAFRIEDISGLPLSSQDQHIRKTGIGELGSFWSLLHYSDVNPYRPLRFENLFTTTPEICCTFTPRPDEMFHFALSLSATSVPSFGGRPHVRVTMTRSLCRPSITIMFCL